MTRSHFARMRLPRLSSALMALAVAGAVAGPAAAAPANHGGGMCAPHGPMSRLTVLGSGEARVSPDLAIVQMGVTSQAATAAEAMAASSSQQGRVIEALREAGIAPEDIQTAGLNLTPVMDYSEGRAPEVTGYRVSNIVSARITEVGGVGEVLDAVVSAGANEINGITFQRNDSRAVEDEARRDAVEDARHKAGVLAEAAGLKLGPVIVLRDVPQGGGMQPVMMKAERSADAATPVEAGEVGMSAQVEMEFALTGDGAADCGPAHRMHHGAPGQGGADDGPRPGQGTGAPGAAPAFETGAPDSGGAPTGKPEAGKPEAGPAEVDAPLQPAEPVVPMGEPSEPAPQPGIN